MDEKIIMASPAQKKHILKKLYEEKRFHNYKFYTFDEIKKNIYGDYDKQAILYVMKECNVSLDIAKIFLENMYFLQDVNDAKVNFLINLKGKLENKGLWQVNGGFKEYILDKEILVYEEELSLKEKKILNGLNVKVMHENYFPKKIECFKASDISTEVESVFEKICMLISSNVPVRKIKIIAKPQYYNYLNYYAYMFDLPINVPEKSSLYSLSLTQEFLRLYDGTNLLEVIEKLKDNDINYLIDIINKSASLEGEVLRKEFIISDLKSTVLPGKIFENGIDVISYDDYINKDDYVFWLGFNLGDYPKIYKDDEYLSDDACRKLGLDTSSEKNILEEKKVLQKIYEINNLYLFYKECGDNGKCYPSTILDILDANIKEAVVDRSKSYSKDLSEIFYASLLDNLYKYNARSLWFDTYANSLSIFYRGYDNKYKKVNNSLLKEVIGDELRLSYTSLESYYECSFKYYVARILKLDLFESSLKVLLGKVAHYIVEKGLKNDINIDEEVQVYIRKGNISLNAKEMFYLKKLGRELEGTLSYLRHQQEIISLKKSLEEEKISVVKKRGDTTVLIEGIIDKVLYDTYNGKDVVLAIDYKTGKKDISLKTFPYGINMQLPMYLYLLRKSSKFSEARIGGFYFQQILTSPLKKDDKKTLEAFKSENMRLNGYTNSDENILRLIDENYASSKIIKGLKCKKDGEFLKSSKVLDDAMMDTLAENQEAIIDDAIENIFKGEFAINPKVIDKKNYACTYCSFRDICFKTKQDEVIIESEVANEVDE